MTVAQLKKELEKVSDDDLVFIDASDHILNIPDTKLSEVYSNGQEWMEFPWEDLDEPTVKKARALIIW